MLVSCVDYQSSTENLNTGYDYAKIYTDWANCYLERTKSKKKVTNLSEDCRDGLLLADVIEAVTSFKVRDLIKKPKNLQQMQNNVGLCLSVLRTNSVDGLETITTEEICSGRLKSILSLFFALSRFHQQHKQSKNNTLINFTKNQQQPDIYDEKIVSNGIMPSRNECVSNWKCTAIPLPSYESVKKRNISIPPTPNHTTPIPGMKKPNICNSLQPTSFASNNRNLNQFRLTSNYGLRPPSQCRTKLYTNISDNNTNVPDMCERKINITQVLTIPLVTIENANINNGSAKQSMIEKLKLFQNEKLSSSNVLGSRKQNFSKRTSSSSGVSSSKSERSDSSLSLNDMSKTQMKIISLNRVKESKNTKSNTLKKTNFLNPRNRLNIKDKSPARKPQVDEIRTSNIKNSEIKPKSGSKTILSSFKSRSEQKRSHIAMPKSVLINTNYRFTPKPVAAVKGTSKLDASLQTEDKDSPILEFKIRNNSKSLNIFESKKNEDNQYQISNKQIGRRSIDILPQNPFINPIQKNVDNTIKLSESSDNIQRDILLNELKVLNNQKHQGIKNQNQNQNQFNNAADNYNQENNSFTKKTHDQNTVVSLNLNSPSYSSKQKTLNSKRFNTDISPNITLMRFMPGGRNSHLTLLSRSSDKQKCFADYYDLETNYGYCSDGDIIQQGFHKLNTSSNMHDTENGYLSEGHSKHILSFMRKTSQLPTTIEEKIRSNQSLENIENPENCDSCNTNIRMEKKLYKINREQSATINKEFNNDESQQLTKPNTYSKQINLPTSSCRTKCVSQSFGYIKRLNGSNVGTTPEESQSNILLDGRTAHVSAMSNSGKIKSTCSSNDKLKKSSAMSQHRSFSLTGPGATQLSQSIRERLTSGSHSLPKPGVDLQDVQHRISNQITGKIIDGSLSDTQTYAEIKPEYSNYAMWLKHSNTTGCRLSESDSLENIKISSRQSHSTIYRCSDTVYSQFQSRCNHRLNRSNSIRSTKSEKMYSSMLSRGIDIESEPYYCLPFGTVKTNLNSQIKDSSVPWSLPTSPIPPNRSAVTTIPCSLTDSISPTKGGSMAASNYHRPSFSKKNDEAHGSTTSLLSGGSSLYSSAEERQANEVRRLKRELADAKEQVMSLSSQLSTNAHVVTAFEQSLGNMTSRLQHLTATAERKDSELTDMRQTIELLRKQSIQAGLTTAHMQSMGVQTNNQCDLQSRNLQHQPKKEYSTVSSKNMDGERYNIPTPSNNQKQYYNSKTTIIQRHHSSDSMCSLNSINSNCSGLDKKKKKGWLRSSFTKAFSRNAKITKTNRHISSSFSNNPVETSLQSNNLTLWQSPISTQNYTKLSTLSPTCGSSSTVTVIENAKPIDAIEGNTVVEDLKKQLREKDLVLTDIRLEALSSASQLESLKDTVIKMRAEMISLKQNNERLQKLVTSRSLAGSETSIGRTISPIGSNSEARRYSLVEGNFRPPMDLPKSLEEDVEEENIPPAPAPEPPPEPLIFTTHIDLTPPPPTIEQVLDPNYLPTSVGYVPDVSDGKKLAISVYLAQPESFSKYNEGILESVDFNCLGKKQYISSDRDTNCNIENNLGDQTPFSNVALNEFIIAYTYISGKTTWQNLDYIVRKTFKDYVSRVDPGTNLGLNTDSITSYHLGEAKRGPEIGFPELLPCGYIVGNVRTLYICLQGVGSLSFDSLIPRSIVNRYINLLTEHRRLILCGPSGTGKSYLARRLAEFLVAKTGRGNLSEAIATFNVDHKSSKELRQYLGHIAEQASIGNDKSELPSVIILDNLHNASALSDVFSCLLSAGSVANLPCIIGTMSQATCNTTNLQLHHNFRWVLTANHMEPVKGFLGRFLRRKLFIAELQTLNHQPELASVLSWLPTVWQHINRFLENHSSSDVTIGPRLFLSCPLDLKDSQVWFTDIWNYHLAPYLVEAVKEGVQLYGRRGGAWNDPSTFIYETYPWPYGPESVAILSKISAEQVGLEGNLSNEADSQDPLLNMLMRLQEAANFSDIQEQESDCASLDSNITPESPAGTD